MAAPVNPVALPGANNVSPLTADDQVTATGNYGITQVGARDAVGLPTGSGGVESLVTRAYNLIALQPLRDRLVFEQYVTQRITGQTHVGAVVNISMIGDLADDSVASAQLLETYDVMPTKLKSYGVDATLREYGRVVTLTRLLEGTSRIPIDPVAGERIGRNGASTMDRLVIQVLYAAGGMKNDGTAGAVPQAVTSTAGKPSTTLRAVAEYFRTNNVEPFANGLYAAIISPGSMTKLRADTDTAGWRVWQNNNSNVGDQEIRRRMILEYEGFQFNVSNRVTAAKDIFLGQEGLAKVYPSAPGFSALPQTVVAPVADRLRRFYSVGWYWMGGYSRLRAEAIATADLSA